jgi:hypothetical protein
MTASYRTIAFQTNGIFINAAKNLSAKAGQGHGNRLLCRLSQPEEQGGDMNQRMISYLKRMGLAAFLFFFLKGLAWLAVFYFGFRIFG